MSPNIILYGNAVQSFASKLEDYGHRVNSAGRGTIELPQANQLTREKVREGVPAGTLVVWIADGSYPMVDAERALVSGDGLKTPQSLELLEFSLRMEANPRFHWLAITDGGVGDLPQLLWGDPDAETAWARVWWSKGLEELACEHAHWGSRWMVIPDSMQHGPAKCRGLAVFQLILLTVASVALCDTHRYIEACEDKLQ